MHPAQLAAQAFIDAMNQGAQRSFAAKEAEKQRQAEKGRFLMQNLFAKEQQERALAAQERQHQESLALTRSHQDTMAEQNRQTFLRQLGLDVSEGKSKFGNEAQAAIPGIPGLAGPSQTIMSPDGKESFDFQPKGFEGMEAIAPTGQRLGGNPNLPPIMDGAVRVMPTTPEEQAHRARLLQDAHYKSQADAEVAKREDLFQNAQTFFKENPDAFGGDKEEQMRFLGSIKLGRLFPEINPGQRVVSIWRQLMNNPDPGTEKKLLKELDFLKQYPHSALNPIPGMNFAATNGIRDYASRMQREVYTNLKARLPQGTEPTKTQLQQGYHAWAAANSSPFAADALALVDRGVVDNPPRQSVFGQLGLTPTQ